MLPPTRTMKKPGHELKSTEPMTVKYGAQAALLLHKWNTVQISGKRKLLAKFKKQATSL